MASLNSSSLYVLPANTPIIDVERDKIATDDPGVHPNKWHLCQPLIWEAQQ